MRLTPKQFDVLFILQTGGELRAPLCDDIGPNWWLLHGLSLERIRERTVNSLAAKGFVDADSWKATITEAGRNALADAIAA